MTTRVTPGSRATMVFKPRPQAIGHFLTTNQAVRRQVLAVANEVADEAQRNLNQLGPPGPKVIYPKWAPPKSTKPPVRWSAKPNRVAQQIRVKDTTQVFPLGAPKYAVTRVTRVGLVVSDHPYSWPYQWGGLGIRASGFFTKAVATVRGRHAGLVWRRYKRPPGI